MSTRTTRDRASSSAGVRYPPRHRRRQRARRHRRRLPRSPPRLRRSPPSPGDRSPRPPCLRCPRRPPHPLRPSSTGALWLLHARSPIRALLERRAWKLRSPRPAPGCVGSRSNCASCAKPSENILCTCTDRPWSSVSIVLSVGLFKRERYISLSVLENIDKVRTVRKTATRYHKHIKPCSA